MRDVDKPVQSYTNHARPVVHASICDPGVICCQGQSIWDGLGQRCEWPRDRKVWPEGGRQTIERPGRDAGTSLGALVIRPLPVVSQTVCPSRSNNAPRNQSPCLSLFLSYHPSASHRVLTFRISPPIRSFAHPPSSECASVPSATPPPRAVALHLLDQAWISHRSVMST